MTQGPAIFDFNSDGHHRTYFRLVVSLNLWSGYFSSFKIFPLNVTQVKLLSFQRLLKTNTYLPYSKNFSLPIFLKDTNMYKIQTKNLLKGIASSPIDRRSNLIFVTSIFSSSQKCLLHMKTRYLPIGHEVLCTDTDN